MLFVGAQPGDQEDKAGRPFVGPAGAMLDKGLKEAGIDRSEVFVTNPIHRLGAIAAPFIRGPPRISRAMRRGSSPRGYETLT